jgi:5-methylcytosine-specific restriction endonuclease McrA
VSCSCPQAKNTVKKKNNIGKYHWKWKGGITSENNAIRNSKKMKKWRKNIFLSDGYICQKCKVVGGKLHAHHIKKFSEYPQLRFDVNNGIALCKECHKKIHKGKK